MANLIEQIFGRRPSLDDVFGPSRSKTISDDELELSRTGGDFESDEALSLLSQNPNLQRHVNPLNLTPKQVFEQGLKTPLRPSSAETAKKLQMARIISGS